MKQPDWLERAIDTHNFHAQKVRANGNWTLRDSANALKRSLGSICEDIKLANWSKTHSLERFSYAKDALAFIREKATEIKGREI